METSWERELRKAWRQIERGLLDEPEETCRNLVESHPELVGAEFALAVILSRRGDTPNALVLIQNFLKRCPDHVPAFGLAAQLLVEAGRVDEALELAKRAFDLDSSQGPMLLHLIRGKASLAKDDPISALKSFRDLVQLDSQEPTGFLGAGDAFQKLGSSFDAAGVYARAAALGQDKSAHLKLGDLELKLGRPNRALAAANWVLDREPGNLHANVLAGQSLIESGNTEGSLPFWERIEKSGSESDWVSLKRGVSLCMMGQFEAGEGHLLRSVELQPVQGTPYYMIFANRKAVPTDAQLIAQMESNLLNGSLALSERAALAFGLGKAWDDLGDPEKCFSFYDLAHSIQGETVEHPFDPTRLVEQFELQKALFSDPPRISFQQPSPVPIFVLGMMRSGTTLTEQMLSAHSQVVGAGEVDFWTGSESLLIDRSVPVMINEVARERTSTYHRILSSFGGDTLRVVDKHPGNLNVVGMIHYLMPEAHIICLRRSPIDTAVSLWATHSNPFSPFTTTRRGIVEAIRHSAARADYWKNVIPQDRFLEVPYEDLTRQPEVWIRKMLDFCGLPWEEQCFRASENLKKIRTPSLWQVRQPVYTTSIDRWKRFEPWLGEFSLLREN